MKKLLLASILLFITFCSNCQYLVEFKAYVNKISYDLSRDLIYATIKGGDSVYPNSLVAIEPATGKVKKNVFVGSDPSDFVITYDSNYLFIAFESASIVKKIDLNSFQVIQEMSIDGDNTWGQCVANSLAVIPGNNKLVIVSKKYTGVSPAFAGIEVFSDGVKLPWKLPNFSYSAKCIDYLLSSNSDTVYGYESASSAYEFYQIKIYPDSGAKLINYSTGLYLTKAIYEKGLIFDNNGKIINPSTLSQIGKISISTIGFDYYAVAADSAKNKVFFSFAENGSNDLKFYSFSRSTFGRIAEYTAREAISSYSSPAVSQLIRVGKNGLATVVYDDYYFSEQVPTLAILNNSSLIDSVPEITQPDPKYILYDTIYTHIYDTVYISVTDTLIISLKTTDVPVIKSEIFIYPNPVENLLHIVVPDYMHFSDYKLYIYNSLGVTMYDNYLDGKFLFVDVSEYKKGSYFLKIEDNQSHVVTTKNLIIK